MENTNLLEPAIEFHNELPARIREYLNTRGIPNLLINFHLLGWNGQRITIPILNREGGIAFFKLAKDPDDTSQSPKMITTRGASAEIYGWDQLLRQPPQIIICEGEFDRLVLEAKGFCAVTSTGGAGTFKPEWAKEFEAIPEVFVCYDNDEAGKAGAERVGTLIPHAKIVELPEEVGPRGDITDFFVRLGKTRSDFEKLLSQAMPAAPAPPKAEQPSRATNTNVELKERIRAVKRNALLESIVARYVKLYHYGKNPVGLCPFHDEKNASFTVFPETGTFWCFGCGKHGDVITFVMEMENFSFIQALKALEQDYIEHGPKIQTSQSGSHSPESDPDRVFGI